MTLKQYKALWRAFGNLGYGMAAMGNEHLLTDIDVDTLNAELNTDPDYTTIFKTTHEQTEAPGDPMFPASMFDQPKPTQPTKPKSRDLNARAERVLDSLLQDPELAVQVFRNLGNKRFAEPWKKNHDAWVRKAHGHDLTVVFMENFGSEGKPDWRLVVMEEKGKFKTLDHTDDLQAGKDALDFFLLNTGWVLL